MIQIEHLSKVYNGIPAVDDLTLKIPEGEIFGLLGPNGAGKSTTILMLIGLVQPTSGRCVIDDLDVSRNPIAVKMKIGYMPEDVGFYGNLTAEENLDYFGRLYRLALERRKEEIPNLLKLVGLEGVTKSVDGYSKGMRQRLGLAKALLNKPSVVILDEPTANLDPQGVADYRRIIRETAAHGATVIVCSHLLDEVSRICTSVGILSRGKLIAHGAWKDLAEGLEAVSTGHVTLHIETTEAMPELVHPEILDITFAAERHEATVIARSDIRDDLGVQLGMQGIHIRGLSRERLSLEDIFLSYYHQAG
jgi:ABC-2 type transport system ATP-binding protein